MSVQTHQIIEVDCGIDSLDRTDIVAEINSQKVPDEEALDTHIEYIADECVKAFKPRGVYKLFNPAICTLPPDYTTPAIKLVGTMMVLKGKAVYDRMRKANHCTLMTVTLGSEIEQETLRKRVCYTELDSQIFDACCSVMLERAADKVTADIIRTAVEAELYTDERLSPGEEDFPLDSRGQILFYTQAEKRLGVTLTPEDEPIPHHAIFAVVGMYDKSQKGRRRACGRCKYREFCSIRAIGMNCHGRKGTFK